MRRKLKRAMLLLLSALAALLVFVGCELGMTKDQALNAYDLKASVTYYANGGDFGNGNKEKELFYKANSRPLNIGVDKMPSGTSINLTRENYIFDGWCHIKTDSEGNLLKDDSGMYQLEAELIDFSTAVLAEGDAWHIGAKWTAKAKVRAMLVCDDSITDKDGTVFAPGSQVKESNYMASNNYKSELKLNTSPINLPVVNQTHTFVGYYFDEACTQLITEELKQEPNQTEDVIVYAKYIPGEWTIIRTADNVIEMFAGMKTATNKYYFIRDIDMSSATCMIPSRHALAATVEGNGFTVSNLSITKKKISEDTAIFGAVKASAVMRDLTFADVDFEYGLNSSVNAFFVCTGIESGATIENVKISGKMEVGGADAANMLENTENCMFGGYAKDADYLSANPNGFIVTAMALKYKTSEYIALI